MIVGSLKQLEQEKCALHPEIYRVLQSVLSVDLNDLSIGRHELDNGHYMNVDQTNTESEINRRYESHKKFIDIQLMLDGEELISYIPLVDCQECIEDYPEKDLYFWKAKHEQNKVMISLKVGRFAIFYPGDVHKPLIACDEPKCIKKIVIKVNMERLV